MQRNKKRTVSPFQEKYAKYYDLMYSDKPYSQEASYIYGLIKDYGNGGNKVLDCACGTGNHLEWFKEWFDAEGLDISPSMLKIAKKKMPDAVLHCCSMERMRQKIQEPKDAIVCLFNAFCYLTQNSQIRMFLNSAYSILEPVKGVLIFDFRSTAASIRDYSPVSNKEVFHGEHKMERYSKNTIDLKKNVFNTIHRFTVSKKGRKIATCQENHQVRFFSPMEVRYMLEVAGFSYIQMFPFMGRSEIDGSEWHITVVAR